MNIFKYLLRKRPIVRSTEISSTIEQSFVLVEIIPSEIRDVVSKFQILPTDAAGRINNTCGYKSPNYAIIEAQNVGLRLLKNVKPENLLFFFGETVELLQSALQNFCDSHLIPYPMNDCNGSINKEQYDKYNKSKPDPLAIVLCKIINADLFQKTFFPKQQNGSSYPKCYEVSWGELQNLQKNLNNFGEHVFNNNR